MSQMYQENCPQSSDEQQFGPTDCLYNPRPPISEPGNEKISPRPVVSRRKAIRSVAKYVLAATSGATVTGLLVKQALDYMPQSSKQNFVPEHQAMPPQHQITPNTQNNHTDPEREQHRIDAITEITNEATVSTQRLLDQQGTIIRAENGVGSVTYINNTIVDSQPYTYRYESIYATDTNGRFINDSVRYMRISGYQSKNVQGRPTANETGSFTLERSAATGDWTIAEEYQGEPAYDFSTANDPTEAMLSRKMEQMKHFMDLGLNQNLPN